MCQDSVSWESGPSEAALAGVDELSRADDLDMRHERGNLLGVVMYPFHTRAL